MCLVQYDARFHAHRFLDCGAVFADRMMRRLFIIARVHSIALYSHISSWGLTLNPKPTLFSSPISAESLPHVAFGASARIHRRGGSRSPLHRCRRQRSSLSHASRGVRQSVCESDTRKSDVGFVRSMRAACRALFDACLPCCNLTRPTFATHTPFLR